MWRTGKPPLHPDVYQEHTPPRSPLNPIVIEDVLEDQRDDDVIDLTAVESQEMIKRRKQDKLTDNNGEHATNVLASNRGPNSPRHDNTKYKNVSVHDVEHIRNQLRTYNHHGRRHAGSEHFSDDAAEFDSNSAVPKSTSPSHFSSQVVYERGQVSQHRQPQLTGQQHSLNLNHGLQKPIYVEDLVEDIVESRRMKGQADPTGDVATASVLSPRKSPSSLQLGLNFAERSPTSISPIQSPFQRQSPPSPDGTSPSSNLRELSMQQRRSPRSPTVSTAVPSAEDEYSIQAQFHPTGSVVKRYSNKFDSTGAATNFATTKDEDIRVASDTTNPTSLADIQGGGQSAAIAFLQYNQERAKPRRTVRFQSDALSHMVPINPGRSVDPVIAPDDSHDHGNRFSSRPTGEVLRQNHNSKLSEKGLYGAGGVPSPYGSFNGTADAPQCHQASSFVRDHSYLPAIGTNKKKDVSFNSQEAEVAEREQYQVKSDKKRTLWTRPRNNVEDDGSELETDSSAGLMQQQHSAVQNLHSVDNQTPSDLRRSEPQPSWPIVRKQSTSPSRSKSPKEKTLWNKPGINVSKSFSPQSQHGSPVSLEQTASIGTDEDVESEGRGLRRSPKASPRSNELWNHNETELTSAQSAEITTDESDGDQRSPQSESAPVNDTTEQQEAEREKQILTERRFRVLEKARALLLSPKSKEIAEKSKKRNVPTNISESLSDGFGEDIKKEIVDHQPSDELKAETPDSNQEDEEIKTKSSHTYLQEDASMPFDEDGNLSQKNSIDDEKASTNNKDLPYVQDSGTEGFLNSFESAEGFVGFFDKISKEIFDEPDVDDDLHDVAYADSETPSLDEKELFDSEAARRIFAALNTGDTVVTATTKEAGEASPSPEKDANDSSTTVGNPVIASGERDKQVNFMQEDIPYVKSEVTALVDSKSEENGNIEKGLIAGPSTMAAHDMRSPATQQPKNSSTASYDEVSFDIPKKEEESFQKRGISEGTPGGTGSLATKTEEQGKYFSFADMHTGQDTLKGNGKHTSPKDVDHDSDTKQQKSSRNEVGRLDGDNHPVGDAHRREVMWTKKRSYSLPKAFPRTESLSEMREGAKPSSTKNEQVTAFDQLRATLMQLDVPEDPNLELSSSDGNQHRTALPSNKQSGTRMTRVEPLSIDPILSSYSQDFLYSQSSTMEKDEYRSKSGEAKAGKMNGVSKNQSTVSEGSNPARNDSDAASQSLLKKIMDRHGIVRFGSSDAPSSHRSASPLEVSTNSREMSGGENGSSEKSRSGTKSPSSRATPVHRNGSQPNRFESAKTEIRADESDSNDRDAETREDTDSKISLVSYLGSEDSDLDTNFESSTVPMIVKLLDKGCAWLEGHNCGFESPSLLKESSKSKGQTGGSGLIKHSSNFNSKNLKKKAPLVNKYAGRSNTKTPPPQNEKSNGTGTEETVRNGSSPSKVRGGDPEGGAAAHADKFSDREQRKPGETKTHQPSKQGDKLVLEKSSVQHQHSEKTAPVLGGVSRPDDAAVSDKGYNDGNAKVYVQTENDDLSGTSELHPIRVDREERVIHRTRSRVDPPMILSRSEGDSTINLLSMDDSAIYQANSDNDQMVTILENDRYSGYFGQQEQRTPKQNTQKGAATQHGGSSLRDAAFKQSMTTGNAVLNLKRQMENDFYGAALVHSASFSGDSQTRNDRTLVGADIPRRTGSYGSGEKQEGASLSMKVENTGLRSGELVVVDDGHPADDSDELFVISESFDSQEGTDKNFDVPAKGRPTAAKPSTGKEGHILADTGDSSDPPEDASWDSRGWRSPIRRPKEDPQERYSDGTIHAHSTFDQTYNEIARNSSIDPDDDIHGAQAEMETKHFHGREDPSPRNQHSHSPKRSPKKHDKITQIDPSVFRNLTEEERLAALELAERLRHRAEKLKKRRKKREKQMKQQHLAKYND
ncbi:hypothetical protein ACA910_022187 [Epithemia clementina (nom. ined.)]